jgi:hypothetical protein
MLTVKMLTEMEPHKIFASGLSLNGTKDWVAVRGGIPDWCIYEAEHGKTMEEIADSGDKIHSMGMVRELINADDDSYALYRH